MALINAVNISKEYGGETILNDVSLTIGRGEALALIGYTGAGKTTLIRLLDLLEKPSSGSLYFDGKDVNQNYSLRLEARRRMAYVQQKPVVFNMSVYDNIAYGLKWRQEKSPSIRRKVEDALSLVGMEDYSNRNARTLSGGETQRIAIARALVIEPEVLFLDEPTANLDPNTTSKIEEVLAGIIRGQKTALCMATHDMPQGQRLASKIGVILNGKIMQAGTPHEIFCCPVTKEVAEFVGIENMLPGIVKENNDNLANISVEDKIIQAISDAPQGKKVYVLIRPEDITFATRLETTSARNVFRGVITNLIPLGPLVRIELDCGFPLLGVLTANSAGELGLSKGKELYATFKATATHTVERHDTVKTITNIP